MLRKGVAALEHGDSLWKDTRGDAVVEATILFPIMIMIFAGIVLLAMYLPTRAILQRATQDAATAIAVEKSDTWLVFDVDSMEHKWSKSEELDNVYLSLIRAIGGSGRDDADNAEQIVLKLEDTGIIDLPGGPTEVTYGVVNYVVYKEIVVTATRTIPSPVDLSFVGFPSEITVTVTSTAVVQNGDEFVRNMDLAADITLKISEAVGVDKIFQSVKKVGERLTGFLGI